MIWEKVKQKYYVKTPCWFSPLEAMVYPNLLGPGQIISYKELLDYQGQLKTIEELKEQGLKLDWWSYGQIKTRYKRDMEMGGIYNDLQEFDKILLGTDDKLITKSYKFLLTLKLEEEIVKDNMIAWAKNFGHTIQLDKWLEIWGGNYKLTMASSYKENLYKMFFRWHLPPARLAKMFPHLSPICWKCQKDRGTYYHVWWTCPVAKKYWNKVRSWIIEITGYQIQVQPETFLLSITPENIDKRIWYLIVHIITAARLLFAQKWKSGELPSEELLIKKILECAELDNLTKKLRNKGEIDYEQNWEAWYRWIEKRHKD